MDKCSNCGQYKPHYSKGYCNPCYQLKRIEDKQNKLPKKKCECSYKCKIKIPIINKQGKPAKYAANHNPRGLHTTGKRYKVGRYWAVYKPNYKYTRKKGSVSEHRYIMYIYLSILNNKPTYIPKNKEVHHKNKDTYDNRIENLILVTRKQHKKEHRADKSGRICNICNQKTKHQWYSDIDGWLCRACYDSILYYKHKFNIQLIG